MLYDAIHKMMNNAARVQHCELMIHNESSYL